VVVYSRRTERATTPNGHIIPIHLFLVKDQHVAVKSIDRPLLVKLIIHRSWTYETPFRTCVRVTEQVGKGVARELTYVPAPRSMFAAKKRRPIHRRSKAHGMTETVYFLRGQAVRARFARLVADASAGARHLAPSTPRPSPARAQRRSVVRVRISTRPPKRRPTKAFLEPFEGSLDINPYEGRRFPAAALKRRPKSPMWFKQADFWLKIFKFCPSRREFAYSPQNTAAIKCILLQHCEFKCGTPPPLLLPLRRLVLRRLVRRVGCHWRRG
jgi:hypothetical protein